MTVAEVRPAAVAALGEVFDLTFEALPDDDAGGLWAPPVVETLAARTLD